MFDKSGFYREIGILLQAQRKRRGLTQEDIALALGIPRPTYANAEAGRQRVAVDLLWKAAIVLDIPIQKLVPEPLNTLPLWGSSSLSDGPETVSFGYILPHEASRRTTGSGAA